MIHKIRNFILAGITSLMLLAPVGVVPALAGVASADITQALCNGVGAGLDNDNISGDACTSDTNSSDAGIKALARTITNVFSVIVGAASIIMIIYGGFRYITSGGDSGKVGNAKNTLIYAIVGLVIVAIAQIIVRFVLSQAQSAANGF